MGAGGVFDAPVVEAHGQVEQPAVHACEVEVEEAGQALAIEHHVVAEQVGVHGAARQRRIGGRGGHMVLEGQLGAQQVGRGCVYVRDDRGHGLVPPGQAAQIGLLAIVVASGQVHARQHLAHGGAVRGLGRQLALAGQAVDDGGRLAAHAQQDVAAAGLGLRVGHGNAGLRQVLHQVQVEGQLLGRQALEQRQHPLALFGGEKVVGVLYAALDAAQLLEGTQGHAAQQLARVFVGDFGENGHVALPAFRARRKSLSSDMERGQRRQVLPPGMPPGRGPDSPVRIRTS